MQDTKFFNDLKTKIAKMFVNEDTGHDFSHLERVYNLAMQIQQTEGGDPYVIAVSALVHDIHRLMSNKLGYFVPPEDSIEPIRKLLMEINVDKNKLEQILDVVKNHDDKLNKNQSLETLIIQDADMLDALGETGLNRTLTYCKTKNIPITVPIPLDCEDYIPDVHPISTCHYIYRTMIPHSKSLYTNTARYLAKNKIKILENFIKENYKM